MLEFSDIRKLHNIAFTSVKQCPEIIAMQSNCRVDFTKPLKDTDYADLLRPEKFCKGDLP